MAQGLETITSGRATNANDKESRPRKLSADTLRSYKPLLETFLFSRSYREWSFVHGEPHAHLGVEEKPILQGRFAFRGSYYDTSFKGKGDDFVYLSHIGLKPWSMDPYRSHSEAQVQEHFANETRRIKQALTDNLHMIVGGLNLLRVTTDKFVVCCPYSCEAGIGTTTQFDPFSGCIFDIPIAAKTQGIAIGLRDNSLSWKEIESLYGENILEREERRFNLLLSATGTSPLEFLHKASSLATARKVQTNIELHATYLADVALPGQIFAKVHFTSPEATREFSTEAAQVFADIGNTYIGPAVITPAEFIKTKREAPQRTSLKERYLWGRANSQRLLAGVSDTEFTTPSMPPFQQLSSNTILYNIRDPRVEPTLRLMIAKQHARKAREELHRLSTPQI